MTIDHAKQADIPRLTKLWQEAFGDSEEFVATFFRTGFSPARSAVAQGGAGALYWFDCLWKGKKIAYIYAVATEKASRDKGICAALMAWTHGSLKAAGYAGAILVPADQGLARMYGKMGYLPLPTQEAPAAVLSVDAVPTAISAAQYSRLRRELLPPGAVHHTGAAFSYMAEFLEFYQFDGGILCQSGQLPLERLPGGQGEGAMYLPFDEDEDLPTYFALGMG